MFSVHQVHPAGLHRVVHLSVHSAACPSPVVSPTGSRPPSRNRNTELPGDEELGFEAAVAALGRCSRLLLLLPGLTEVSTLWLQV